MFRISLQTDGKYQRERQSPATLRFEAGALGKPDAEAVLAGLAVVAVAFPGHQLWNAKSGDGFKGGQANHRIEQGIHVEVE